MPGVEFALILAPKLIETTVNFGPDAELQFTFDVHKVSPLWFDNQRQGLEKGDVMTVSNALASVIESWNLEASGEAVPVDAETLARFPIGHLNAMMEALSEQPTRAEGEVSSVPPDTPPSTSSEPQPTPPNGAATSTLQTTSASLSGT